MVGKGGFLLEDVGSEHLLSMQEMAAYFKGHFRLLYIVHLAAHFWILVPENITVGFLGYQLDS